MLSIVIVIGIAVAMAAFFIYMNRKGWISPVAGFICMVLFLAMIAFNASQNGGVTSEFIGLSIIILGLSGNQALNYYKGRELSKHSAA